MLSNEWKFCWLKKKKRKKNGQCPDARIRVNYWMNERVSACVNADTTQHAQIHGKIWVITILYQCAAVINAVVDSYNFILSELCSRPLYEMQKLKWNFLFLTLSPLTFHSFLDMLEDCEQGPLEIYYFSTYENVKLFFM